MMNGECTIYCSIILSACLLRTLCALQLKKLCNFAASKLGIRIFQDISEKLFYLSA